jgi:glyoxylase-like metal-dependent hydrolase (beta-lactamase superfamily II)
MTIASNRTGLTTRADLTLASPAIRADRGVEPVVTGFYEATTGSVQYVVADPITRRSDVIDPVLDFDLRSGSTRTTSSDRLLRHIETHNLTLEWILDTHPHADHFSAAGYLKDKSGAAARGFGTENLAQCVGRLCPRNKHRRTVLKHVCH